MSLAGSEGAAKWKTLILFLQIGADGGQFTYGGLDSDHCGKTINYVPLSTFVGKYLCWRFEIKSFGTKNYESNQKATAISDTGTSLLIGPQATIEKVIHELGGKVTN